MRLSRPFSFIRTLTVGFESHQNLLTLLGHIEAALSMGFDTRGESPRLLTMPPESGQTGSWQRRIGNDLMANRMSHANRLAPREFERARNSQGGESDSGLFSC